MISIFAGISRVLFLFGRHEDVLVDLNLFQLWCVVIDPYLMLIRIPFLSDDACTVYDDDE